MPAPAARARFDDDIATGVATSRRRRRVTALAAVALATAALAPHGALLAQSTSRETRPCTEIDNDAERLACYDRALRPPRDDVPAPAATATVPAPTTAAPTAPGSAGAPPAASAQSPVLNQPAREVRAAAAAAPQAPAAPAAPEPRRGRHRNDKADADRVAVVIVKVSGRPGQNIFTTESGETWTQTDGSTQNRFPSLPFRAEISPGAIGSFFLIPSEGRAIRVHREE